MIQVEPVKEIDVEVLAPLATAEFGRSFAEGHNSTLMWVARGEDRVMFYVGLHAQRTMLSAPEGWMLLCEGFEMHLVSCLRVLRSLLIMFRATHGSLTAVVREEHLRFAKLMGLRPTRSEGSWWEVRL